ncbi:mast cell-expressed membrane protein 1 isoform 1-T2 [Molossus nigricans]
MCGQIGRLGTMDAEEIYINQEAGMQAAAFKDKQREAPVNKKGVDDPDYENITLAFRNQDQPKGNHSPPKSEVPAWSRPSSDSIQAFHWLHKAIMSLYILLTLFSIILLAWVLVKNSEMSQELLVLKKEIWNVSSSACECQERQKQSWSNIQQSVSDAKKRIDTVKNDVQTGNEKLKTLSAGISQITTQLQKISELLQKMPNQQPTHK